MDSSSLVSAWLFQVGVRLRDLGVPQLVGDHANYGGHRDAELPRLWGTPAIWSRVDGDTRELHDWGASLTNMTRLRCTTIRWASWTEGRLAGRRPSDPDHTGA